MNKKSMQFIQKLKLPTLTIFKFSNIDTEEVD